MTDEKIFSYEDAQEPNDHLKELAREESIWNADSLLSLLEALALDIPTDPRQVLANSKTIDMILEVLRTKPKSDEEARSIEGITKNHGIKSKVATFLKDYPTVALRSEFLQPFQSEKNGGLN